jgi:hypothetical protein
MQKKAKHHSRMVTIPWILCACLALPFLTGCGGAAPAAPATQAPVTPAPAAPETTAPAPTQAPIETTKNAPMPTATPQVDIGSQLQQIDGLLRQQMSASIAYNKPESMNLGGTTTIELLLNPSLPEEQLGTQVTEGGAVTTSTVEITPQMKAVLLSPLAEAFTIQPLYDEIQLISGTKTTKWAWFVTARKSGTQNLVLVIYRLVKFEGQDYWREVETYKADIEVKVPFTYWILSIDWKWLISIFVALLSLPFIWRWFNRRKKE